MPRITPVSWKEFKKFVLFVGCYFVRQKGRHLIYMRKDLKRPVVFQKGKDVPVFIIHNNLRTLGLTSKDYFEILRKI